MHGRKAIPAGWRWVLVPALAVLVLSLLLYGCGKDGEAAELEGLILDSKRAADSVSSYHLVLSMSFEGEGTDRVKTEELVVDVDGDDVSVLDTFYDPDTGEGTVVQELIRVGDRQWRRELSGSGWVEEEPSLDRETAAAYSVDISDFMVGSASAARLEDAEVNGVRAVHLRFELSPENVISLLPEIPQSNLEANTGGQVDAWIDAAAYYPLRYEMLFRNVTLGAGYSGVDVSVVIDITGINQPVEITPPV